MTDYRLLENRREGFKLYAKAMVTLKDIDPAYPCIEYLFDRFELNIEQKFWMAWLYGVTYCASSVFYIYNEFPDFNRVTVDRLLRWHGGNSKQAHWRKLKYQTDRIYVKGKLIEMFQSYQKLLEGGTQEELFSSLYDSDPYQMFHNVWKILSSLSHFGRFSLYIYTELLIRCCKLPMLADTWFLKEADSSRNGLCFALGQDQMVTPAKIGKEHYQWLEARGLELYEELQSEIPKLDQQYYETILCAYKGFFKRRRYLGFYIDRFGGEILTMQENIPQGVSWEVLWQFREETFHEKLLFEKSKYPIKLKGKDPGTVEEYKNHFMDTGEFLNIELCAP